MERWKVAAQFARFGIMGVLLTGLVSALYLALVTFSKVGPSIALTIATVIASIFVYFSHSAFSFRGHGERDRPIIRMVRFGFVNFISYLSNLLFIYLFIEVLFLPEWTPTIAFFFFTPVLSFYMNRKWVFQ